MNLAETIVNNQKSGFLKKNEQLIRIKLKELVFDYTDEILEVLHKTGIPASTVLPANVILTIVIKHLGQNPELRDVIAKMLLELGANEAHLSADGGWLTIAGGALSAVGTVLAGIGRGQYQNNNQQMTEQEMMLIQQQQQEQAAKERQRRMTWIIVGIAAAALIGAILIFKPFKKVEQPIPATA